MFKPNCVWKMSFALQTDFVEHSNSNANYVNVKCYLEGKGTHLSTVSFSGNGVFQYLFLTNSGKMLPVVRSLKEAILVTCEMVWMILVFVQDIHNLTL